MANPQQAQAAPRHARANPFWADIPVHVSRRGHFWIAGERVTRDGQTYQRGPMFVDWEAPAEVTKPLPIALCACRFRDEQAIRNAFASPEAGKVMADVPHFTDAQPSQSLSVSL